MGDVLLQAKALEVGYGGSALFPPFGFDIRRDEFWALVGRNGAGKTTLLRTLLSLLPKVGGELQARDGVRLGYVPQRESVDPSVPARVIDLVRSGTDRAWSFLWPFKSLWRPDAVRRAMRDAQVEALAKRPYAELSEGQKQRVLMARVLAGDPDLLILDEPTSAMDVIAERETFSLLDHVRGERRLALLVVSHHLNVVARLATHVLMVDHEAGKVVCGSIDEALADPFFAERYGTVFSCYDCGERRLGARRLTQLAPHVHAPGAAAEEAP